MPVHDWTRVDAGTFHAFHTAWITHLSETLNGGLLPPDYYAMSEQHGGPFILDVLTFQTPTGSPRDAAPRGGVAVVESPPRVRRKLSLSAGARGTRRTLTIRHVSGHRIIALMEIVSPANKDRPRHVSELTGKIETALMENIHVLLIDIIPPGPHDPQGVHGAVWERFDNEPYPLPADEPLTLASYVADRRPDAYLEHLTVGSLLAEMPLFLDPDYYINIPLEPTYMAAYRGMPAYWRDVVEGKRPPNG
ncbi:MAG: DUF4058 domain-containing protein [Rhodopirellula sp.]|nr:DUF4058 domain-containing protein [Rhodopirellula sp.]